MFSHIMLGVGDVARATDFYDGLMALLGHKLRFREQGWAAWQPQESDRPLFLIGRPHDGAQASPGNGSTLAFSAASRNLVDRLHVYALAHGGHDEGAPGLRPQYHPNYYGAYFRDPDGNKICVVCHAAES
jgi:catechol 2,3-dioxygenase-like lactoylglutathione lyase family enzyme